MSRWAPWAGKLSAALPLLPRLAAARWVVFLWGPCGTALTESAGIAELVASSSVAMGEERPEACLLCFLFLAA